MRPTINLHRPELVLPDGRRADTLRRDELYRVLERASVPGLTPHMGKAELLGVYEAAVISRAEAMRRDRNPAKQPPSHNKRPLTSEEWRVAAERLSA